MTRAVPASEGVAPTLLETPWSPRPEDRIGFFGCRGRLVRIALLGKPGRKPPRHLTIKCPACGRPHPVHPAWRRPLDRDAGQEPELAIDAAELDGGGVADDDENSTGEAA